MQHPHEGIASNEIFSTNLFIGKYLKCLLTFSFAKSRSIPNKHQLVSSYHTKEQSIICLIRNKFTEKASI